MDYIQLSDIFHLQNKKLPTRLDYLKIEYKGITIDVYGVLHGLIGGTNKDYRDIVNATINEAKGLKLCEKSMKSMYKGLDYELDDWAQMPFLDSFKLSFSLYSSPINFWKVTKIGLTEYFRKHDKFGRNGFCRIQDIGGSMAFHLLHPQERRLLAGFLPPEKYLTENILRRENKSLLKAPKFPDEDWSWLSVIEPYANIPLRSIHMIETAVLIAKEKNAQHISLFVGEIHNSDIDWYVTRTETSEWMEKHIATVVENAEKLHKDKYKFLKQLKYLSGISLAASILLTILYTIGFILKANCFFS